MTNKELGNLLKLLIPDIEERIWKKINNSNLTERELEILELRIFDGKTLDETGNRFGVTRERIRQIEARAYRKLRHPQRRFFEVLNAKDFEYYNKVITEMMSSIQYEMSKEEIEKDEMNLLEKFTIKELGLGSRAYNVLKRNGINNLKDLQDYSKEEVGTFKNLGKKSFEEIIEKVENVPFFKFKEV